jgi:hypothetical protein
MAMNTTTSHRAHRGMTAGVLAGYAADRSLPTSPALAATPSSEPLD